MFLPAAFLSQRETELLRMLYFIQTTVWKYLFGHNADLLERDQSDDHTCMCGSMVRLAATFVRLELECLQC
jgi:hypothetical protein